MHGVKPTPGRTYGGRTAAQRQAQRRAELIGAAFALTAEQVPRELSIEGVCRRAGLNKRYFYEAFPNLDALIAAVIETLADQAIRVTLAEVEPGMTPEEATRAAVTTFVTHLTDDPRRAKVLFGAVPAGDAVAGHRATAIRHLIATVAAQGRTIHQIDDDPRLRLAAATVIGGTSQAVLDWLEGEIDSPREELIAGLVAIWQSIGDLVAGASGRAR